MPQIVLDDKLFNMCDNCYQKTASFVTDIFEKVGRDNVGYWVFRALWKFEEVELDLDLQRCPHWRE